jgi:predicted Zn finger-like uncharacterized protein
MIVQCDQCNTRFKLDDAKVKDEGVKVRCSKCKHIFIVKKEAPQEENEFESILGQLGSDTTEEDKVPVKETSCHAFGGDAAPVAGGSETARAEEKPAESSAAEGMEAWPEENFSSPRAVESEPAISHEQGFDFERFSFEEEPGTSQTMPPASEGNEVFTFGDVPAVPREESGASAGGVEKTGQPVAFDSEEDFSNEPLPVDENSSFTVEKDVQVVPAESGGEPELSPHDEFSLLAVENKPAVQDYTREEDRVEKFDFGSIDFGTEASADKTPAEAPKDDIPLQGDSGQRSLGTDEFFAFSPSADETVREDELPPLSIASRRKGLTSAPIIIIVVAVVIVLALAAAGLYFLPQGPAGLEKAGLGAVAKWLGFETKEDGGVSIRNTAGSFVVNKEAGELFVIRGEAVNNFRKPRASIQVKVVLYGPKGQVTTQKSAYCGNMLTNEQIVALPLVKIEEAMNNQFGDSLSNLGVQPGKGIPFVVVLSSIPKDVTEFGVEVIGSTVASR